MSTLNLYTITYGLTYPTYLEEQLHSYKNTVERNQTAERRSNYYIGHIKKDVRVKTFK